MEYCCIRAPRWRPSILSDSPNGSHFKQAWTSYTFNKLQSAHHKPQNQNEPLAVLEMVQGGCASPLCHFKRTVPKLLWQPALSSTPSQGPANNPSSQRTPPSRPASDTRCLERRLQELQCPRFVRIFKGIVISSLHLSSSLVPLNLNETARLPGRLGRFLTQAWKKSAPAIYFDYLSICGLTYLWWGLHRENTSQITGIMNIQFSHWKLIQVSP